MNENSNDIDLLMLPRIINEIRRTYPLLDVSSKLPKDMVNSVINSLENLKGYATVESALDDFYMAGIQKPDFQSTRSALSNMKLSENKKFPIISMFNAPYNKPLGLDAIICQPIYLDDLYKHPASGHALTVSANSYSEGFSLETYVAIFPENFITSTPVSKQDKVIYFVDRFSKRFRCITQKVFPLISNDDFSDLVALSNNDLNKIISLWVTMHEYYHRTGDLPLPEYLSLKSTRVRAAMEELRVDLLAIQECIKRSEGKANLPFYQCEKFIIAERLFRYPLEGNPDKNYDALGSQVLFQYLNNQDALTITNNKLTFNFNNLTSSIDLLCEEIKGHESEYSNRGGKFWADDFAKKWGNFSPKKNKFILLPFFQTLREKLGIF